MGDRVKRGRAADRVKEMRRSLRSLDCESAAKMLYELSYGTGLDLVTELKPATRRWLKSQLRSCYRRRDGMA